MSDSSVKAPMATEEFLSWHPGDGRQWQLIDGQPCVIPIANQTHGELHAEAGRLIRTHLSTVGSRYVVASSPLIVPRVRADWNVRVPALAVVLGLHEGGDPVVRDPILVVEVLSPVNRVDVLANMWACSTLPAVREILVLNTGLIRADLVRRQADGFWPADPARVEEGDLTLESIGLTVKLAALYRTTRLWASQPG